MSVIVGDVDRDAVHAAGASFEAVVPQRLMDTRPSGETIDGRFVQSGILGAGSVTVLAVGGRAGVPFDASAVVLNVTVTEATGAGYLTVYPCGSPVPNASNLNFTANATVPNSVTVKLGDGGAVCLFTQTATHAVVDINGWYAAGASFEAVVPQRLMDTRPSGETIDGRFVQSGILGAGSVTVLAVGGRAGVPFDASAVVLNVTVTEATGAGYLTVYPCGSPVPNASNLNFTANATVPNSVTVKLGDGGAVCLFTQTATHAVVDINGWYAAGASFEAVVPQRLMDTRPSGETIDGRFVQSGILGAGSVTVLAVGGRAGVPFDASAVVLNVTVTEATGAGYLTVYPCGSPVPNASNLNFTANATVPNSVTVKLGDGGAVCLFTQTATHAVVDINGWYGPATNLSTVTVSVAGLGSVVAPPGSLPAGATLSMVPAGTAVPLEYGFLIGPPVDVSTSAGQPTGPVTVHLAYEPQSLSTGSRPQIVHFDVMTGIWYAEPTTIDGSIGTATATINAFSVMGVVDYIAWASGWLTRNRAGAGPGQCQGAGATVSDWVDGIDARNGSNDALRACVTGDDSHVEVHVRNNRSYAMQLELIGGLPVSISNSSWPSSVDDILNRSWAALRGTSALFLGPGVEATLWFNRPIDNFATTVHIYAHRNVASWAWAVTSSFFSLFGVDLEQMLAIAPANCFLNAVNAAKDRSVDAVRDLLLGCAGKTAVALSQSLFPKLSAIASKSRALLIAYSAVDLGYKLFDAFVDEYPLPQVSLDVHISKSTAIRPITSIGSNDDRTCVLTAAGAVECWGRNYQGAQGTPTPALQAGVSNAISVASGTAHACALISDGTVRCWGDNRAGQLGHGGLTGTQGGLAMSTTAIQVVGISTATAIAAGLSTTCALLAAGTVKCWGSSAFGTLGDGGPLDQFGNSLEPDAATPTDVVGIVDAVALSVGSAFACAVLSSGHVRCWGENDIGQLGDGTSARASSTPTTVVGVIDANQVTAGTFHSCVRKQSGSVACWGLNNRGQLGDGSTVDAPTPTTVAGVSNVVKISADAYHTCALLAGGTVACWGDNSQGELGNGSTVTALAKVTPSALPPVRDLKVGDFFTCVTTIGGTALCWGTNSVGQLGTASAGYQSPVPVNVDSIGDATKIV